MSAVGFACVRALRVMYVWLLHVVCILLNAAMPLASCTVLCDPTNELPLGRSLGRGKRTMLNAASHDDLAAFFAPGLCLRCIGYNGER